MSDQPRPSHPRRSELSLDDYAAGVRSGDVAVLARAITLVESNLPRHEAVAQQLLAKLAPHSGGAMRVGITGAPGAGKSTFIEALGTYLVRRGRRVAVLAVDPSSELTGGSILGDKTRMMNLAAEPNAFVRPSPSAGALGGVARKTRESLLICEAAGYDVVLVETVGVGQSETVVAEMTDSFLAIMIPGAGDELQGVKRGLLELVDVIAVNKADGANRAAAQLAASQYRSAFQLLAGRNRDEAPAVIVCSALEQDGVTETWGAVEAHWTALQRSGELETRRRQQRLRWLWSTVDSALHRELEQHPAVASARGEIERRVLEGELPVEIAARQILAAFRGEG